jgi:molybdate transport system regulatory protein
MAAPSPLVPAGPLRLERAGEALLDGKRLAVLEGIAATGSITRAARAAGVSYRTAWLAVDHLNAAAGEPLVERRQGGRRGGGARLTPYGERLAAVYRAAAREHAASLARLRAGMADSDRFLALARQLALRTSARNQLFGTVVSIRRRGLAAEIALRLKGGDRLRSRVTRAGLEELGLRTGDEAYALIKANWVRLRPAGAKAESGANVLAGAIETAQRADAGREIRVRLRGGNILVTSSPGPRAWKPGQACAAVFRPEDVILGIAR